MGKFLNRIRNFLFIILLVVLTFYVFSLNYKRSHIDYLQNIFLSLTIPIFSAWSQFFNEARDIISKYLLLTEVHEENERLKKEIARLESELLAYKEAYIENQRLKRLLEFKSSIEWKSITAVVVLNDLSGWFQTTIINRGKRDGISEDFPVVSDEGLVGRILSVGEGFSRVMLITDPASAVDVLVQRNRVRAILVGKDLTTCTLKYVKGDVDIKQGDLLITSGKDGVFPAGLKVGVVKAIYKDPLKMFQQIDVTPLAKLRNLEEVLVLIPSEIIKRDSK